MMDAHHFPLQNPYWIWSSGTVGFPGGRGRWLATGANEASSARRDAEHLRKPSRRSALPTFWSPWYPQIAWLRMENPIEMDDLWMTEMWKIMENPSLEMDDLRR